MAPVGAGASGRIESRRSFSTMTAMPKVIDPDTGLELVNTEKAARIYGCSMTHLTRMGRDGQLRRWQQGAAFYYDPREVKKVAKQNADIVKRRGGRPRKSAHAA
jgi:hypothetical protein